MAALSTASAQGEYDGRDYLRNNPHDLQLYPSFGLVPGLSSVPQCYSHHITKVYALYGKSRRLMMVLLVLCIIEVGAVAYILGVTLVSISREPHVAS